MLKEFLFALIGFGIVALLLGSIARRKSGPTFVKSLQIGLSLLICVIVLLIIFKR